MKSRIFAIIILLLFLFNICSAPVLCQGKQADEIRRINNIVKTAHNAYEHRDFLAAAENYEKAYKISKTKVYLDNSIVAYLSLANENANDKDYNGAINYCNKVLSMDANNKNAKEFMSDIYFTRGIDYFYTGDLDKAKLDIENSLKYSASKEQTDRAKDGLSKIAEAKNSGAVPVPKYENSNSDSIPEIVDKIEMKLYGSKNSKIPLMTRIGKLEKESLGKTYESDGLIVRVDRLKRTLLPELMPQHTVDKQYENTYVPEIIEQSMGRVNIFGKMPITVFIDDANVKPYKKFYKDAVKTAFSEWEKASRDAIKFQYVNDPARADIQVTWNENFEDFPWQPKLEKEDLSAEKQKMKYKKANAAVQAGSMLAMVAGGLIGVPILGTAGYLGGSLAAPYLGYKGYGNAKLSPGVKINTKITEGMTDEQAKVKIKQIAMHQIGHAIGIYGHSNNPEDIMYSDFKATTLSKRDIKTIQELYRSQDSQKPQKT